MWSENKTGKPQNQSGMQCPLNGKPTYKTCHLCELWQPLNVTVNGAETVDWRCSLVWNVTLQTINNAKTDGMVKATESLRNKIVELMRLLLLGAASKPPLKLESRD